MRKLTVLILTTGALIAAMTLPGAAQSRATVTAADYARAETFLGYNTLPLVSSGPVQANWLASDRFYCAKRDILMIRDSKAFSVNRARPLLQRQPNRRYYSVPINPSD